MTNKIGKKDVFYFEYDCGDYCCDGIFFYRITFYEPVTKSDFLAIMEKARQDEKPYSLLYDKDFQKAYHIKEFEEVPIDYQDMKEVV